MLYPYAQAHLLTSLTSFVRNVFETEALSASYFEPSRVLRALLEFSLSRNPIRSAYRAEHLRATLERHLELLTFTSNAPPAFRDLIAERRTQYTQRKGIFNKKLKARARHENDNADAADETNRLASGEPQSRSRGSRLGTSTLIPFAHQALAASNTTAATTATSRNARKRAEEAEMDELLRDHPVVQQVLEMGFDFRHVRAAVRSLMGNAPSLRPFPRPEMITNWLIDHEGDAALDDDNDADTDASLTRDDDEAAPSLPFERSSFLPSIARSAQSSSGLLEHRLLSDSLFGRLGQVDSFESPPRERSHSASRSSDEESEDEERQLSSRTRAWNLTRTRHLHRASDDEDEEVTHSETQTSDHSSPLHRPSHISRPYAPHVYQPSRRSHTQQQQQSDSEAERYDDDEHYGTPLEEELEPSADNDRDTKQATLSFASPEASAPASPENESHVAAAAAAAAAASAETATSAEGSGRGSGGEVPLVAPAETQELKIGDLVRFKRSVATPRFQWGAVTASSVGVLKDVAFDGDVALVDFAEQSHLRAALSELELSEPIHSTAVCSGCYACPIVGRIYRCRTCAEKHYCEQCFGGLVDDAAQRNDLCVLHAHQYDLFDARGQLAQKALSLTALKAKRAAARTAAHSNRRINKLITSWKQCVAAVRVSSNEENAHRLHDGRGAFWQSTSSPASTPASPAAAATASAISTSPFASTSVELINPLPAFTHWIELELKPGLLVHRLFLRLNPLDQRYLPTGVRVSVYNEPQNMLHLYPAYGEVAAHRSSSAAAGSSGSRAPNEKDREKEKEKDRVLLLTDMSQAYRYVRVTFTKTPEQSKSGATLQTNVRIHGLELECLPLAQPSGDPSRTAPESGPSTNATDETHRRHQSQSTCAKQYRFEFMSSEYESESDATSDDEPSGDLLFNAAAGASAGSLPRVSPPDMSIVAVWGLNDKAQCLGNNADAAILLGTSFTR